MKQAFTIAFLILLVACNSGDDKKVAAATDNDSSKAAADPNVKGVQSKAEELNQKMEALKKMTPLTIEQMKPMAVQ